MEVAPKHHSLLLLRLPGNVERDVYQIKNEILRDTGAVSTQIPAILPISDVREDLADTAVDTLPQREIPPLQLGPITETNGFIVVSAALSESFAGWMIDVATGATASNPIVDHLPGFLIASATDVSLEECRLPDIQLPLRATVLSVENWSIEVEGDPWWLSYSWRVAWSRRIKLRGGS